MFHFKLCGTCRFINHSTGFVFKNSVMTMLTKFWFSTSVLAAFGHPKQFTDKNNVCLGVYSGEPNVYLEHVNFKHRQKYICNVHDAYVR